MSKKKRSKRIADTKKWKKKKHPAAKCKKAKCTICHTGKVLGRPTMQERKAPDINAATGYDSLEEIILMQG